MKATKIDIIKEKLDVDSRGPGVVYFYDKTDLSRTYAKNDGIDLGNIIEIATVPYKKIYIRTLNGEEVILLKAEDEQYIRELIRAEKEDVDYQIRIAVRKREEQIKRSNWWKRLFNKY